MEKNYINNIKKFIENNYMGTDSNFVIIPNKNETLVLINRPSFDRKGQRNLSLYHIKHDRVGEMIGSADIEFFENSINLLFIAVKSKYEQQGYGSLILRCIEAYGKEIEAEKITGYAFATRKAYLFDFYMKNGYEIQNNYFSKDKEKFRDIFEQEIDEIIL